LDKRVRSEDEPNSATVILIGHLAKSHLQIILILKLSDHVLYFAEYYFSSRITSFALLSSAIREMLFGATARLRSIRQTLLRTPVLGGPHWILSGISGGFSTGDLSMKSGF
jgi:hypothetical protein